MKQKLFTLMMLLVAIVAGVKANQTDLISGVTLPDVPTGTLNLSSQEDFTADDKGWIVFEPNGDVRNASKDWFNALAWNTTSVTVSDVSGYTAPFVTLNSKSCTTVRKGERTKNMQFTGAETFSVLGSGSNGNRRFAVSLFSISGTTQTLVGTKYTATGSSFDELLFEDLSSTTTYVAYFYADIVSGSDGNSTLAEVALKAPSGAVDPVLTVDKASIGTDDSAKILLGGKDTFDTYFTAGTLWESEAGGPYISLSTDGTITPIKATPSGYYFTFTANSKDDTKYNTTTGNRINFSVTAPVVATPSITAGGYFFGENKTVEIACETEGATIKYSTDNENWEDYTTALTITETTTVYAKAVKEGCVDSEVASATYTKFSKSELASISAETTWTIPTSISETKLDDTTTPSKYDEYYTYADVAVLTGKELPSSFDGTTLAFSGEFPFRGTNGAQNCDLQFITTVPGTVTVQFSNTGGSNKDRYVKVNETTGTVEADGTTKRTEDFPVSAGTVTITHVKGDGTKSGGIRFYYITFTPAPAPTTETITISGGVTTYVTENALDFSEAANLSAYAVTAVDADNKKITTAKVTQVPAGTPLLIKGTSEDVAIISEASPITNQLVAAETATSQNTDGTIYVYSKSAGQFKKLGTATIPAGKCYLVIEGVSFTDPAGFDIDFEDEATVITNVNANANSVAPVKVIKGGKLYIGNYNVAGQQVK
ncbi:MAG: chitobiase/beta-hexosaminidase C-terminal domain-containing protein [Prevotella sp.]|nr:chitobiase/beta-hexosaminidase C-terminal domain-containing protein [Prevotella sp.]